MNISYEKSLNLLKAELSGWYETIVKSFPNLILAIVVLLFFALIAKIVKRVLEKALPRFTHNHTVVKIISTIVFISILAIGTFASLEILHLEKAVTSILAGAGIIGLALGFAFQEIASNLLSGVLIAFNQPYQVGDIIAVKDYFGEVERIDLRTTSVVTFQGIEVLIPNKIMFTEPIQNFTTTPKRRIDLTVGISYGDDLEKVQKVALKALSTLEQRIMEEEVTVYYDEFGSSSINFIARIWVKYPGNLAYLQMKNDAIIKLKKAFDENNIVIPFPIRTLDFGIKGGLSLSDIDLKQ